MISFLYFSLWHLATQVIILVLPFFCFEIIQQMSPEVIGHAGNGFDTLNVPRCY